MSRAFRGGTIAGGQFGGEQIPWIVITSYSIHYTKLYDGASINQVKPLVKDKYKLLQDSRRIYHKYYLKNNKIELLVFEIFTFIGLIEKSLIDLFIRIKRVTK